MCVGVAWVVCVGVEVLSEFNLTRDKVCEWEGECMWRVKLQLVHPGTKKGG